MYFPEDGVSDNSRTELSEDHVDNLFNPNSELNDYIQLEQLMD